MTLARPIILFALLAGFSWNQTAHSAELGQKTVLRLLSPTPGAEVLSNHPDIQVLFTIPVDHDSLIILLDDNDITAAAEFTEQGFHCKVPLLLRSGKHTLYVAGISDNGPFEKEVDFSSRQSTTFDDASTTNEWALNLSAGNYHNTDGDDFVSSTLDSTLHHESIVKKGNWQVSMNADARMLEQDYSGVAEDQSGLTNSQNQGSLNPERQGLDLNNVLFQAQFQGNQFKSTFELGDLQIIESTNTFDSLSRNGGQLSFEYRNMYINGFSVFGRDTFGLHDGLGIGFDDDNHLYGTSGGIHLLENRLNMKVFYIKGGQKENSYSSWSQEQGNSGNVHGVVLATDFFEGLVTSEFEYDQSDFDPNTDDEFDGNSDEAWRLLIGGQRESSTYEVTYERFGPEYDIPGNLSPKKDYEGITASSSLQNDSHAFSMILSGYHDNVDSNRLYARTNSYAGQVDYNSSKFIDFPLGFSYQHTSDKTTDEPVDSPESDLTTDTLSCNAGYAGPGPFAMDFSTSYSWQNDESAQNSDIAVLSFMLSPSLNFATFSITMSGTLNQNRDTLSGTRTDDYIVTLDTIGSMLNDQMSYEFGGSYDHTLLTSNSGEQRGFTGYGRIGWHIPWFEESVHPTLGLELQYNSNKPQGMANTEETRVFSTLSTSIPFNY